MTPTGTPGVDYALKPGPHTSHTLLLERFPDPGRGLRVLDLGCGHGYLAGILAARGYRVTGIERPGIATADFPAAVRRVEADLDLGLPRLDDYFDIVLCADVLEHLRDPLCLLNRVHTMLAPNARLIASLPNSGHLYFRLNVLAGRFPQHDKGLFDRTHVRFFMWRGWVELLEAGGFQVDSVEPTATPFSLAFPRWIGSFPIRAAEALSYLLARVWKRAFAYQFVVVAHPHTKGS